MRIISTSACALAVVCMATGVSADTRRPLVVVSAEVSATGDVLFVTGSNFGQGTEVRLGGLLLSGVVVTSPTQLKATLPAFEAGSYILEVSRRNYWWLTQYGLYADRARLTVAIGAMGPKGEAGSQGQTGDAGPPGEKGDKGDPGMPGHLALAGQMCPPGVPLRGFTASGGLVCGLTEPTTCGNGVVDNAEEFDPAPGPFRSAPVSSSTCTFDFSQVTQLYCDGACSTAGPSGCDQPDADLLCKLKTGNPNSVAVSFAVEQVRDEAGFSCPYPWYGTEIPQLRRRGVSSSVFYSDTSLLESHSMGNSVTDVVCTNP
jgi:hypothetical protein